MATTSSSFNSNNKDQSNSENNYETQANQTNLSIEGLLTVGYILAPAKIIVQLLLPPNVNLVNHVNVDVQDVNFICPDIDIAPLF